ncbi:MBL fold metallo-hydrolase [Dehalococcoidia bacterium]|nr:MBL fold metallo-hydrolase [Dehalococcoidia bacterium]
MKRLPLIMLTILTVAMLTACGAPAHVTELESRIVALETQLSELETTIQMLQSQLEDREATITDLKAQVVELEGLLKDVSELEDQVTSLETQLTEKDTTIQGLRRQVAEKEVSITDLETQVTGKAEVISALEERVAELERQLEEATTPSELPPVVDPKPVLPEMTVHFIDVGQGDAILLDVGEIEVLIDGGGKSPGVVVYLREHVDGPLEVMVATHPHADHIGGLIAVLDAFEAEEIWLNGDPHTTKTFHEFMRQVDAEGASVSEAERGDWIEAGILTLLVLHPTKPLFDDINENSIVLRLSYGDIDFLFTGDAEGKAETSILDFVAELQAEIFKVGHHGSKTSSSAAFLDQVQPEVAIYMAGSGNRYGHPHAETISALEGIGAEIYGTDINGTILIITDGISYIVQTEK